MAGTTINDLTDDCLSEIFSYLSPYDRINAHQVCSRWDALNQPYWNSFNGLIWGRDDKWYFADRKTNQYHQFVRITDVTKILEYCGASIEIYHIASRVVNDATSMILMKAIIEHCENLKEIVLKSVSPTPEFLELISHCANLEKLRIKYLDENCEDALIAMLNNNKEKLKFFSFHFPHEMDTVTGKFLEYLPASLEELHILDCDNLKPSALIPAFNKYNRLQALTFECEGYRDVNDSDEIIAGIAGMTLISLKLYLPTCKPKSLEYLASLVTLKKLDFRYSKNLEDNTLIKITNSCNKLESLDIRDCEQLTNRGVASLAGLTNLEALYISGLINVTDDAVGVLPNSLRNIWCCKCENVKETGIIKLIRRAPNLTLLNIPQCPARTISTILAAIEETKNRTNNIILEIHTDEVEKLSSEVENRFGQEINSISPFLRVKSYSDWP